MGYNGVGDIRTYSRVALTGAQVASGVDLLLDPIENEIKNADVSFYTIMLGISGNTVFSLVRTNTETGQTFIEPYPDTNTTLSKGCYAFTIAMRKGDTLNFRFSTDIVLTHFILTEHGGVY